MVVEGRSVWRLGEIWVVWGGEVGSVGLEINIDVSGVELVCVGIVVCIGFGVVVWVLVIY